MESPRATPLALDMVTWISSIISISVSSEISIVRSAVVCPIGIVSVSGAV